MSYAIKEAFASVVELLNSAESLSGYLTEAFPYYAYNESYCEPGKLTISCLPEESSGDIWIGNAQGNQTVETVFLFILDTIPEDDENVWLSKTGTTMLDLEERFFTALQSVNHLGATNNALTWRVESIQRDVPIPNGEGGVDITTPIRRTEVRISVKCPLWENS